MTARLDRPREADYIRDTYGRCGAPRCTCHPPGGPCPSWQPLCPDGASWADLRSALLLSAVKQDFGEFK